MSVNGEGSNGNNGGKPAEQAAEEAEDRLEEIGIVEPLDASFLANFIVDGIIFTAGDSLLPKWIESFQSSATEASLTISILSGMYLLVGPLASALANMFGCRIVVIAGSLAAFFGFLISTIAPQVYFLYISFGAIGGIGFGLAYLPSIVIISQYFATKRSMATGIAVCGSGIGTTVFSLLNPYVMSMLRDNWRFFMVYLAICSLVPILSAIAYRPLKATEEQIQKVAEITSDYEKKAGEDSKKAAIESYGNLAYNSLKVQSNRPFLSTMELNAKSHHQQADMWSQRDLVNAVARDSVKELNRPLVKMDVFFTGSTQNLRARSRTTSFIKDVDPVSSRPSSRKGSKVFLSSVHLPQEVVKEGSVEVVLPPHGWKENLKATLASLLDTSLLYSPSFVVLAISGLLTLSCFYVPFNYIGNHLDRISNITITEKKLPISLLGVINIIARIGCGWIADRPQVDATLVSAVAIIAAGLATAAVPLFTEYWHFIAYCFPFAAGVACFAALRSVVCVDLFGLEKLSNAFGILLTFCGIGALVGSPLAAFLKDVTGNFDISFYIMGILMAISGAILLPLRKLRAWEERRHTKDAKYEVELQHLTDSN